MLGYERPQLADEVGRLPAAEVRRDALLDGLHAQLLEAEDLGLRELVEAVVGERRPAPQRERRPELGRIAGARAPQKELEAPAVDRLALDLQRVAGGPAPHRERLADAGPQPRDLLLQRLVAAVGRLGAP